MKHFRKAFVILLAVALLSSLVSCTNNVNVPSKDTVNSETLAPSATSPNSTDTKTTVSSKETSPDKNISKDEAIDIAINHFGLKKENCKFITSERDDGKFEIEFFSEGIEYTAKIDPMTGKVLEWESERAD